MQEKEASCPRAPEEKDSEDGCIIYSEEICHGT
jgi:hypothetical protein